jgi:hypothetical protein
MVHLKHIYVVKYAFIYSEKREREIEVRVSNEWAKREK